MQPIVQSLACGLLLPPVAVAVCLLMAPRWRWSPRSASCRFSSCRAISCRCSSRCWWCLHWHRFRRPKDLVLGTHLRHQACHKLTIFKLYRVIKQVSDLGWNDLVLRIHAAGGSLLFDTYCPSRMREYGKS